MPPTNEAPIEPNIWKAKLLAAPQGHGALIMANAIACGKPAIMTERAIITLRSTKITTLDQETVEIKAGPENQPGRIPRAISGRVQHIMMEIQLEWENGEKQEAEVETELFADQDGEHTILVWCSVEPPDPNHMREFAREILGHQLDQQQQDALAYAALHTKHDVYEFKFHHRIRREQLTELESFPDHAYTNIVVEFTGTEDQAMHAARRLYGDEEATEAVRMALTYNQLPPETMYDEGLPALAELHSEQTSEAWEPLPAQEIPMQTFAKLLEIANDSYWENHEKYFQITPATLRQLGINIEAALRRH